MSDSYITTERAGAILEIRFNRPEKKNAITNAMYGVIADAIAAAERDSDVRVLLFTAAGDFFTSGNDLMDFAAVASGAAQGVPRESPRFIETMMRAEKPIVACVQGHAVGVGVTMLMQCDLVYIAEDATLSTPFVNLGLVPENGSSLTFPTRLGHQRAFALLGLAEKMTGREAAACGLANAALPAIEVAGRARAAAEALAAKPAEALRITKQLLRDPDALVARAEKESSLFAERLRSPEAAAAFASFLNKKA